jgi:hypothetical protein
LDSMQIRIAWLMIRVNPFLAFITTPENVPSVRRETQR